MAGQHPTSLPGAAGGQIDLPLPLQTNRAGHSDEADQRDRRNACALRLSAHSRAAATRRLARQQQAGMPVDCEMGLQLRNKSPKRRVKAQLREDRSPATAANQVWAMDFVHDQLFDGRKIRVLTIVDTFTRLSPAIEVRQNFRGIDVVDTIERVRQEIGCPKTIRLDNGPEFISKELDLWAFMRGVTLDFSRPGKPTDNAFIESLNGKFRAECLNANWFLSLDEARRKCEAWRRDYNEVRPHSAIGNQVPAVLHRMTGDPGQPVTR